MKNSWPNLPVFDVMQSIGNVDENEMFRTFNMGIGMVFIVNPDHVQAIKDKLIDLSEIYEIGAVKKNMGNVSIVWCIDHPDVNLI